MQETNLKKQNDARDTRVAVPVTDIYETVDQYALKMEMPGVTRENLEILMENNDLEIRGKVEAYAPAGKDPRYSEFSPCDYYRKFTIGNDIDRNKINATLESGVLTLVLQKHEAVKPKKIPIKVE